MIGLDRPHVKYMLVKFPKCNFFVFAHTHRWQLSWKAVNNEKKFPIRPCKDAGPVHSFDPAYLFDKRVVTGIPCDTHYTVWICGARTRRHSTLYPAPAGRGRPCPRDRTAVNYTWPLGGNIVIQYIPRTETQRDTGPKRYSSVTPSLSVQYVWV